MAEEITDQQWEEIESHLFQGRKIEAIKVFREHTGADLTTAKGIIDEHQEKLRTDFPEKFSKAKVGCAGMLLALIAGACCAAVFSSRML